LLNCVRRYLIFQSCFWQDLLGGHSLLLLNLKLPLPLLLLLQLQLHLDITRLRTSLSLTGARMRINWLYTVWYDGLILFFYFTNWVPHHPSFHHIAGKQFIVSFLISETRAAFNTWRLRNWKENKRKNWSTISV